MRPRALLLFVLLNVLVTTGVAFAIISVFGNREDANAVVQFATVEVLITPTRDINFTPEVIIITATPLPGEIAQLPTGVLDGGLTAQPDGENPAAQRTVVQQNTLPPDVLEGNSALAGTAAALPENCIVHTLSTNENPALLAQMYDTPINTILLANGLTEDDARFLQIGQVLVIPLEGCDMVLPSPTPAPATSDATADPDATASADDATVTGDDAETAEGTPAMTPMPTITATITLPPTATNAQVEIVEVNTPGDITAESVVIRNNGRNVVLTGWTLSDLDGNEYVFPERTLFSDGEITLFTGSGVNTAVVMYWGNATAVWGEVGDVVTLADANGVVQATYRIPSPVNLP